MVIHYLSVGNSRLTPTWRETMLNKIQKQQVKMIEAYLYVGSVAPAAASLSGLIRWAKTKSQREELYRLAVTLGLHNHPKFII